MNTVSTFPLRVLFPDDDSLRDCREGMRAAGYWDDNLLNDTAVDSIVPAHLVYLSAVLPNGIVQPVLKMRI